jgi:hypothetical protein
MGYSKPGSDRLALIRAGGLLPVILLCAAMAPTPALTGETDNELANALDLERTAWRYMQGDLTVTITEEQGTKWVAVRSDGEKPVYDEVGRTEGYVELQNRDSKLFVRLYTDHAAWRRPKDKEWTRWVKGGWTDALPTIVDEAAAKYRIRLAYFVPRDRKPIANYEQKIRVVMSLVSELYLGDLRSKRYDTTGLQFEVDDSTPIVQLIRGARDAAYYNNAPEYQANEQWRRLLPECREKVGDPKRQVIVVFAETYDDGPAEHLWPGVLARGAYYSASGGLAVFSAHLLRDDLCAKSVEEQLRLLQDKTPLRGRKAWGHAMHSPRSEFIEDGIGAVAHELGHALGLPHDRRTDDQEIMGNGFRSWRRNLDPNAARRVGFSDENGWLLMSSRYLAKDLDLSDNQPPMVTLSKLTRAGNHWTVSVQASDNTGLKAIVFMDRNAGSIIAGRQLKGTTQKFRQQLSPLKPTGKDFKVFAIVTDVGGNQTRVTLDSATSQ